jgi:hypothetical protein
MDSMELDRQRAFFVFAAGFASFTLLGLLLENSFVEIVGVILAIPVLMLAIEDIMSRHARQ